MVKFLLELGADPSLRDPTYHAAPIGWALHNHQDDVVEYLLPSATIFDAVQSGGVERAAILLRQDPSLANARDEAGNPLVFYLHPEIRRLDDMVQLLAAYGADFGARTRRGTTLVDRALARGWAALAEAVRARIPG
jgi:ankyrin repeat protein